jgi:two-component system response regulator AtoC
MGNMAGENNKKTILIIDDEENMRHMLSAMLRKNGYITDSTGDGDTAIAMMKAAIESDVPWDFILCDIKMPNMTGMDLLKNAKEFLQFSTVIMMSAYGSIESAVESMKLGAYDYISKPFKKDEILLVLTKATERMKLKNENISLKKRLGNFGEKFHFSNIVGNSKSMMDIFNLAGKASRFNTTVLITGESGTGKELIARGIHFASDRADKSLVAVNCGGIPENLLESEFFGHKKGAFTGAVYDKKGLFEEAEGGTIFLDEIGELPLTMQVKLLRALQENEIRPVGSVKTKKSNIRVIAATTKNLGKEVKKGNFREDLFYRLNVLTIELPPLRDKAEDIPVLANHFLDKGNKKLGRNIANISPATMKILIDYNWPGNVRELENIIERALVLTETQEIVPENLPPNINHTLDVNTSFENISEMKDLYSLKTAREILEKKMITKALKKTAGNRTRASRMLEISHPSLLSKLKLYNITL